MMLSVEEARACMLATASRLSAESVPLGALDGRTLASPLLATRDQPPFDAAVMDGYAFRASDTPGSLTLVGESGAGHAFNRPLGPREAVRVSTGAPLPEGANAVLAQEEASVAANLLTAPATQKNTYVRRRGGDFAAGDMLLEDGRIVDAGAVVAIAGAGYAEVKVTRQPIVSVLSNGDELVSPGANPRDDQVFDAASHAVASLVRAWGGSTHLFTPLPDDRQAISGALSNALEASDLVLVVGGASVGPHDHVRPIIRELGAELLVEGVAVRPGRPTWFAVLPNQRLALGLPGNPASALVCTRLFAVPLLEKMLAGGQQRSCSISMRSLAAAMPANDGREAYVRALAHDLKVTPIPNEDSSMMSVLAQSTGLIRREIGAQAVRAGDQVQFVRWTAS